MRAYCAVLSEDGESYAVIGVVREREKWGIFAVPVRDAESWKDHIVEVRRPTLIPGLLVAEVRYRGLMPRSGFDTLHTWIEYTVDVAERGTQLLTQVANGEPNAN